MNINSQNFHLFITILIAMLLVILFSGQANVIALNDKATQSHNFHDAGDQDWAKLYGLYGVHYYISTENLPSSCGDAIIELYDTDGTSKLEIQEGDCLNDVNGYSWSCPQNGIYYVKLRNRYGDYGEKTQYNLKVAWTFFAGPALGQGFVGGLIRDASIKEPIEGAVVVGNSIGLRRMVLPSVT